MKTNFGVIGVSYVSVIFAFGWTVVWSLAFAGVYDQPVVCDADGVCQMNYGYMFLLFLSYYWTHQVLMVSFCEMSSNVFMGKWFT